ncbi:unnamed protein product [Gadus morhua 'NCC']
MRMLLERALLPQIESLLADRTELWVSAGDVSLSACPPLGGDMLMSSVPGDIDVEAGCTVLAVYKLLLLTGPSRVLSEMPIRDLRAVGDPGDLAVGDLRAVGDPGDLAVGDLRAIGDPGDLAVGDLRAVGDPGDLAVGDLRAVGDPGDLAVGDLRAVGDPGDLAVGDLRAVGDPGDLASGHSSSRSHAKLLRRTTDATLREQMAEIKHEIKTKKPAKNSTMTSLYPATFIASPSRITASEKEKDTVRPSQSLTPPYQ